ncbi:inactive rhomboid protein 1 [Hermetia illucens]|uniref:inactive rhomboid protein 1 n=1 Tax=Hermetia illucens TaxID=343691 RepID=UPI0018CC02E9|nr:inactive rhomboid protein 1 [Hermetia illucens]XP_037925867.1 inactive rhomboid protein 1 [Hermetia illucens]XP_037925868.1 inactive rhomboid protein 1 [Hermetia illucens]XP_037925869.1 inactive rhomboid protein 1 [Hermetia illucens]
MSTDDGIDYHKPLPQSQQKHHLHHSQNQHSLISSGPSNSSLSPSSSVTPTQSQQPSLNSLGLHQQSSSSAALTVNTIERRRKSSLSYQYQLQQINSADLCVGSGSPCPSLEPTLAVNASQTIANNVCSSSLQSGQNYSPSRYSQQHQHQQQDGCHLFSGRLSLHSIDRYDDSLATCCLPPPSPAPNSDRFVMGIPSPSISSTQQIHHYDQSPVQHGSSNLKYGSNTLQRTLSPSSRYRMSERYREAFPRCDRFVTATHFLANSTPLVSSDTYAYLSSAVHTPVKRYVPTPPPLTEIYTDISQSSHSPSQCSNNGGGGSQLPQAQNIPPQNQQHQQHASVSTLPYRFRMKCCSVADQGSSTSGLQPLPPPEQRISVTDHYVTTPRMRPMKCHMNGSSSNQQLSIATATPSPTVVHPTNQPVARQTRAACVVSEYMHRTPSVEFLGTGNGRVVTPVSVMSEPNSSTCLHCSTMRRTTGVHQTTQTTGPTSPVLQNSTTMNAPASNLGGIESTSTCGDQFNSTASPTPSSNPSQTSAGAVQPQQHHPNPANYPPVQSVPQPQPNPQMLSSHSGLIGRAPQPQPVPQQPQPQPQIQHHALPVSSQPLPHHHASLSSHSVNNSANNVLSATPQRNGTLTIRQQMQRLSRKQRLREYVRREIAKFFGVDVQTEEDEQLKWNERQKRLALRRFGPLKPELEPVYIGSRLRGERRSGGQYNPSPQVGDRPDILPAQTTDENQIHHLYNSCESGGYDHVPIEKKASVPSMIASGLSYIIQTLNKRQQRNQKQWSRSFAPTHITTLNGDNPGDMCEGLTALQEDEVFFDIGGNDLGCANGNQGPNGGQNHQNLHARQIYMGERVHGWRTSGEHQQYQHYHNHHQQAQNVGSCMAPGNNGGNGAAGTINGGGGLLGSQQRGGYRGTRISPQLLDGVLDNSRRPVAHKVKLFRSHELDDRNDHRPFFTYWINTVQILVLILSLICYGIGPIGIGVEQKSGQVLVTSLSLQTVQHQEQRNVWIGPRGHDLVHLGGKFAACMRRDVKIIEVIAKTRRQERETACCIRNDDSGCVQSSQADCSVRGLWPTKSISTWKKWSPGESGPGGRISGSVCGLDPKFCDAPASIAPYEWPDDITKWPICRKTNSFSQRFRFKDQTAEHMVCEVIGHPCCTGVFGECRITTREYCDFVNGYFHEEASLCSQVSCLNNVCGMFPFFSTEVPDQFYRLFTSLCLHAGIIHLAITVAFQHIFLADLERLIGPIRTAIVYIGSGLAGNLTSAILVPYKLEVGPLASLAGVLSSLVVLLLLIHWKQLKKPHLALMKLTVLVGTLFGMGTLPWQQNFAGLIAGLMCGMLLTIALVPFVSVTKYGRKSKINLIWTCMLFHLFVYAVMFVIFYIFPTEFTSFNFGDVLSGSMGTDGAGGSSGSFDTNILGGGNTIHQRHHHHGGEDIAMNGGVMPPSSLSSNNDQVSRNGSPLFTSMFQEQQSRYQQQTMQIQHHRNLNGNNMKTFSSSSIVACEKGSCAPPSRDNMITAGAEALTGSGQLGAGRGHADGIEISVMDFIDAKNGAVEDRLADNSLSDNRVKLFSNNKKNLNVNLASTVRKRLLMTDSINDAIVVLRENNVNSHHSTKGQVELYQRRGDTAGDEDDNSANEDNFVSNSHMLGIKYACHQVNYILLFMIYYIIILIVY